jgi:hypothetical protein
VLLLQQKKVGDLSWSRRGVVYVVSSGGGVVEIQGRSRNRHSASAGSTNRVSVGQSAVVCHIVTCKPDSHFSYSEP